MFRRTPEEKWHLLSGLIVIIVFAVEMKCRKVHLNETGQDYEGDWILWDHTVDYVEARKNHAAEVFNRNVENIHKFKEKIKQNVQDLIAASLNDLSLAFTNIADEVTSSTIGITKGAVTRISLALKGKMEALSEHIVERVRESVEYQHVMIKMARKAMLEMGQSLQDIPLALEKTRNVLMTSQMNKDIIEVFKQNGCIMEEDFFDTKIKIKEHMNEIEKLDRYFERGRSQAASTILKLVMAEALFTNNVTNVQKLLQSHHYKDVDIGRAENVEDIEIDTGIPGIEFIRFSNTANDVGFDGILNSTINNEIHFNGRVNGVFRTVRHSHERGESEED